MALALAMALDALFGEPKALYARVPHPAILMGRLIGWADARYNTGRARKLKGTVLIICLLALATTLGTLASALHPWVTAALAATLFAQKSLIDHVQAVANALRQSETEGRRAVAMIVGRDTAAMDGPAIARAAIESAAENFSDGVLAPIFWFAIAGLPGLICYKIVNTADSMIGYRTPRHADFGWAAARLDDLLNWIPARLTALLFCGVTLRPLTRALRADARLHRSPNAGWPEAAIAPALNVALSGPRSYEGTLQDFPFVHATGNKTPGPKDIEAATTILWRAWTVLFLLALLGWGFSAL